MKKSYLLVFNDDFATRERVAQALDRMPCIIFWRYDMTHAFYLISTSTATEITLQLRNQIGVAGRFIITEFSENRDGWVTMDSWHLIRDKELPSQSKP